MSPTAWTAPALGAQRLSAARPRTLIWFAVGAAAVPPTFVPSARPLLNPPRRALHPRPPCHGRSRTGPYPALSGTSPPASAHACGQVARRPRAAALPMRQSFEAWTAPALGAQRLFAARPRTLVWFAVAAAAAPPPLSPARPLNPPRPTGAQGSCAVHPRRRSCHLRLGIGTDRRPALARKLPRAAAAYLASGWPPGSLHGRRPTRPGCAPHPRAAPCRDSRSKLSSYNRAPLRLP